MKKLLLCALVVLTGACQSEPEAPKPRDPQLPPNVPAIGADRDEHGCTPSEGYRWSKVQNKCIRLVVGGIRLLPQDSSVERHSFAFVVFSGDREQAELYLPREKGSVVMNRTGKADGYAWVYDDYTLTFMSDYALKKGEKTLFRGK
ncbi:MAG: hypothetical protein SFV52_08315 [Saprospiraceae bacterium]|nr:hypothetical protein [Saprospiraceae bacterium]